MSEIEKIIRSVVLGGIGAAATLVEKGGIIARDLVEKGEETLRQNQDVADEIKDKVRTACEAVRASFDIARMTPEERADLRRQLDAFDEADAACAMADEADETGADDAETVVTPQEDAPLTEDAYTAAEEPGDDL